MGFTANKEERSAVLPQMFAWKRDGKKEGRLPVAEKRTSASDSIPFPSFPQVV